MTHVGALETPANNDALSQAYLMVLSDILQLAQAPEYSSHPKQQPEELVSVLIIMSSVNIIIIIMSSVNIIILIIIIPSVNSIIIMILACQVGFSVPLWMIEKMRAYIDTAKTNPDTTDEELLRMAEEYAEMETEAEAVKTKKVNI